MKSGLDLLSVFVARGVAGLGGILLSLAVARLAGPSGLGQFTLFMSMLGLFTLVARRGLNVILIRTVARAVEAGLRARTPALFRHAAALAIGSAAALAPVGALLLHSGLFGAATPGSAWIFLFCLPALSLLGIVAGYFKGLRRASLAVLFEIGGVSLGATGLIGLAMLLGAPPDLAGATLLFAAALAIFSAAGLGYVLRDTRRGQEPATPGGLTAEERRALATGQGPFTVIALSGFLIQAGSFVLVAPFLSVEDLGLTRAAERLAVLISFPALAVNPFIAARIVRHLEAGRRRLLWLLIGKACLAGLVAGVVPLVLILAFPGALLSFFAPEFIVAVPYLRVLALVHFAILVLSPFAMVVDMAGGERKMMYIAGVAVVAATLLYPLLSMALGAAGFVLGYTLVSVGKAVLTGWLGARIVMSVAQR